MITVTDIRRARRPWQNVLPGLVLRYVAEIKNEQTGEIRWKVINWNVRGKRTSISMFRSMNYLRFENWGFDVVSESLEVGQFFGTRWEPVR